MNTDITDNLDNRSGGLRAYIAARAAADAEVEEAQAVPEDLPRFFLTPGPSEVSDEAEVLRQEIMHVANVYDEGEEGLEDDESVARTDSLVQRAQEGYSGDSNFVDHEEFRSEVRSVARDEYVPENEQMKLKAEGVLEVLRVIGRHLFEGEERALSPRSLDFADHIKRFREKFLVAVEGLTDHLGFRKEDTVLDMARFFYYVWKGLCDAETEGEILAQEKIALAEFLQTAFERMVRAGKYKEQGIANVFTKSNLEDVRVVIEGVDDMDVMEEGPPVYLERDAEIDAEEFKEFLYERRRMFKPLLKGVPSPDELDSFARDTLMPIAEMAANGGDDIELYNFLMGKYASEVIESLVNMVRQYLSLYLKSKEVVIDDIYRDSSVQEDPELVNWDKTREVVADCADEIYEGAFGMPMEEFVLRKFGELGRVGGFNEDGTDVYFRACEEALRRWKGRSRWHLRDNRFKRRVEEALAKGEYVLVDGVDLRELMIDMIIECTDEYREWFIRNVLNKIVDERMTTDEEFRKDSEKAAYSMCERIYGIYSGYSREVDGAFHRLLGGIGRVITEADNAVVERGYEEVERNKEASIMRNFVASIFGVPVMLKDDIKYRLAGAVSEEPRLRPIVKFTKGGVYDGDAEGVARPEGGGPESGWFGDEEVWDGEDRDDELGSGEPEEDEGLGDEWWIDEELDEDGDDDF